MRAALIIAAAALALGFGAAFWGDQRTIADRENQNPAFVQQGTASYYGPGFHGRKTASGERFDQNDMTAAHRKLPLGTPVTVTNLENGKQVEVEINDRGPYVGNRVLDLSKGAAQKLDMTDDGTTKVKIEATEEQLIEGRTDEK